MANPQKTQQAPDFIPAGNEAPDFIPAEVETTSTGIAAPQGIAESTPATDIMRGISQGAASTVGNAITGTSKLLHMIPYVGEKLAPEAGIRAWEQHVKERSTPETTAQNIGKTGEQIGEWLIPGPAEGKAGTTIAEHLPMLGKASGALGRIMAQTGSSALMNKLQGGSALTGAELGAGGGAIGEGLSAVAPKIMESAIGVGNRQRGFGRTIGRTMLDETSGIRPETVARQAQQKATALTGTMEQGIHGATQAGVQGSIHGAQQILDDAIAKAPRNAQSYRDKLESLRGLLDLGQNQPGSVGFLRQKVTGSHTPDELLEMKRGIDKEISSWDRDARKSVEPVKRQLYRAIDRELDQAAPGNAQLNQRISSLIPGSKRAEETAKNAELTQRVLGRIARPTGALAGAALGYHEYGPKGALAGLVLPELLSSPAGKIAAARAFNSPILPRILRGSAAQFTEKNNK